MSQSLDQEIQALQTIFWSERDPEGLTFAPLADVFRRRGELREAMDLLTDGMSRHPDYVTGHVVATKLYLDQGMDVEAGFAARRVLSLDPENLIGLSALATVMARGGDLEGARRLQASLEAVDPGSEEIGAVAELTAMSSEAEVAPSVVPPPELAPDEPFGDREVDFSGLSTFDLDDGSGAVDLVDLAPDPSGEAALELTDEAPYQPRGDRELTLDELGERPEDDTAQGRSPGTSPFDVVALDALAPDPEAEEAVVDVVDLGALAPDPEPEEAVVDVVDLGALAPDPEPTAGSYAPAASATPSRAAREESADMSTNEPVYTRTLAELYIKQGFDEKALEVYRSLQRREPDAEDLRIRIEALERGERPDDSSSGNAGQRVTRQAEAGPVEPESEEEVETLARDLAQSGHEGPRTASPFAWNEDAGDGGAESSKSRDGEADIGSYFDGLLGWEEGTGP